MSRYERLPTWAGAMATPLEALDDVEGEALPPGLGPVIDAHVHVFPDKLMHAVQQWLGRHGFGLRYNFTSEQLIEFLLGRGVSHLVLLHYSHKPGMARELNRYVAGLTKRYGDVTGLATVFPGEDDAPQILAEAFDLGLAGVKLHAHVQCFEIDGPGVREVCAICQERGLPLVAHFGREPKSPAYRCDPHELCSADRVVRLLDDYPGLKLCVPHLGADEFDTYRRLAHERDNLWLDTTMMVGGFFRELDPGPLSAYRADRLMFGTDFCNIPFAWDREIKAVAHSGLEDAELNRVLSSTAREFYSIGG